MEAPVDLEQQLVVADLGGDLVAPLGGDARDEDLEVGERGLDRLVEPGGELGLLGGLRVLLHQRGQLAAGELLLVLAMERRQRNAR